MGNPIENSWREKAIFITMLMMLAGLFISRATLSISMAAFLFLAIVHQDWKAQLTSFIHHPYLLALAILFFVPFISGLWSHNKQEWMAVMQIKLPLLFFPVAFAGSWQLNARQWKILAFAFLGLVLCGAAWSMAQYLSNSNSWNQDYLKAKLMATPLENDHIRFSWLVAAGTLLSLQLWKDSVGRERILLGLMAIVFSIYLHLLAARMGLACLYMVLLVYAVQWVRQRRKAYMFLLVILLLPLLAWLAFPTFQNRIRYMIYDITNVRSGIYLPGSNDGARMLSLQAGWHILQEAPLGVGAGDLQPGMHQWYAEHTPALATGERFLPCSELLVFGGVAGWPGMIILIGILMVPFLYPPKRKQVFWYCLNAIVVFSFVFDMSIEAQFGVFIFSFLPLWWWKWLNQLELDG